MSEIRVPAARCRRGPDRGRDRAVERRARRSHRAQPGARRDRDGEVARRAAVAVRGRRVRAARRRGQHRRRRHADHLVDPDGCRDAQRMPRRRPRPPRRRVAPRRAAAAASGATVASHASAPSEGGGAVLVGHGTSGPSATRRKRHPSPGGAHENLATVPAPLRPWPRPRRGRQRRPAPTARPRPPRSVGTAPDSGVPVIAKPPIRKLAKDLGRRPLAGRAAPVRSARSPATT